MPALPASSLKDLRIELHGDLDLQTFLGLGEGNAGSSSIGATVRIEADAEGEAIEALHRKVIATSPVGHCLSRSVPIETSLALGSPPPKAITGPGDARADPSVRVSGRQGGAPCRELSTGLLTGFRWVGIQGGRTSGG